MAITPEMLTIEEYLKTEYRPDCDFVDGYLEERNAGLYDHGRTQLVAAVWFFNHEKQWRITSVMSLRTRVLQTRVRVADISVMHSDAPREQVTLMPPVLCIEVLSPEDRLQRIARKMDDFAAMGVSNLWIIDPEQRIGYVYTSPDNLKLVTERLTIPGTPIYLDLPSLFAELD